MADPPCRPTVIASAVLGVLVAAAAGCYRAGLMRAGLACSVAAALAAVLVGAILGAGALRVLPALALLTAAIAGLRMFGDALWPCPVSCQGGGSYQHLLGLPSWAWAMAGVVAVAAAAIAAIAARRPPRCAAGAQIAVTLAWMMAGGSLFYLWIAWLLGMRCGYCYAVHTGIIAAALLTVRAAPPRWWAKAPLLFAGFAALFLLYAPPAGESASMQAPPPPPARRMSDSIAAIDAVRRLGNADAALCAEFAIDLHCPHCAAAHGPLLDALRPQIAAGRLQVVQRFLTRPSDPAGSDLAMHVLAAGSAKDCSLLLSLLLGTPEDRGWAQVRARAAEVVDLTALERRYLGDTAVYDLVVRADAERLAKLKCTQTPSVVVLRKDGSEVGRWQGERLDPAAIAAAIAAAPPAP